MSSSPEMDRKYAELLAVAQADMIVAAEHMKVSHEKLRVKYPWLPAMHDGGSETPDQPRNGEH